MADTFNNDLRVREQEAGSNSGTWGDLLNTTISNLASAFGQGSEAIPNASTHTITLADGAADEARSMYLKCTGGGQACTVTLAPNTISKVWIISNETAFTLTFSQGSGANVAVAAGAVKMIVTDGAGSGAAVTDALSGLSANVSDLTTTGNISFGDNDKAIFGAGSDLQIYHDGSHSYVSDQGTGNLNIQTNGVGVVIEHTDGTNLAVFNAGDGTASLYHSGNLKLATTSSGIDVTGDVDASANYKVNGTLLIDSSMNLQNLNLVQVATGSSTAPSIRFTGDTNTGFARPAADTLGFITGGSERLRIDSSGNLLVGTTSTGLVEGLYVAKSPSNVNVGVARFDSTRANDESYTVASFVKNSATTNTSQVFIIFAISGYNSACGQINANGAGQAAFGVNSDRRLKENITDLPNQLANITALRPVEFDYIESEGGGHQTGFIAQEVEEIYPDLVGERHDGMKTLTGISKMEARLIKAIQEQQAIITALETRITQLENN